MKMDDLISREEALKLCDKYNGQGYVWSCIRGDIEKLPPAQPQNTRENTCETTRLSNDSISRQAAIDAIDVLCQEHRYRIPGKRETYSPYNEAWQDALGRAEGAIGCLPSAQPEIVRCKECKHAPKCYGDVLMRSRGGGYIYCPVEYCSAAERRSDEAN